MRALDGGLDQTGVADVDEGDVLSVTGVTNRCEVRCARCEVPLRRARDISSHGLSNQRAKFLLSHF